MKILLRSDASSEMGMGHLMRCLALSEAWHDWGGEAVLVTSTEDPVTQRISDDGGSMIRVDEEIGTEADARRTAEIAQQESASWVVLDGYHFSDDYEKKVSEAGIPLMAFDDYGHSRHAHVELVVNANAYALEQPYRDRGTNCDLLLGSRYVILRREFGRYRSWQRTNRNEASRILVTFGGSEAQNPNADVLKALSRLKLEELEVIVLLGAHTTPSASLEALAADLPGRVEFRRNAQEVAPLMAWADIAVGACGTSTWERAFMQLPAIVFVLADNQLGVARSVEELGLGRVFSPQSSPLEEMLRRLSSDAPARVQMAVRGRECVDGEGADRVIQRLSNSRIRLRPVSMHDSKQIFEWANEEATRAASFSSDPITWNEHAQWFSRKIADSNCHFFIGMGIDDVPVGQIRLDVADDRALLSVSMDRRERGKHLGSALIAAATDRILKRGIASEVMAKIKPDNSASIHAFLRAGFAPSPISTNAPAPALYYTKKKTA